MTINIIEHLENIKIFTDYINTRLESIENFWNHIDNGGSIYKNRKLQFGFDDSDYDPTEEELEKLSETQNANEKKDLSEEYTKYVKSRIETLLDYDNAEISEIIELHNIFDEIIDANGNLQNYLNTSKDIVDQYVKIIDQNLAEDFFKRLSDFEKSGKSILNELRVDENESESNEPTIRQKIESAFSFMLKEDPRKQKKILSDDDFEKLIGLITHYFNNNFTVPEINKPISEVNTAKGNIIFSFKDFFKREHPQKTYPLSLFELYKNSFFQFREDSFSNFLKTSEPNNYKDLIKKVQ